MTHHFLRPFIKPPELPEPHEPDTFYWKTGAYPAQPRSDTELTCEQWRHRTQPESFTFEIVSTLDNDVCEGALHVEIHASNLTDPIKKAMPIQVSVQTRSIWDDAIELIRQLD